MSKFIKGQSGNPKGRARGAANKTTRAFREAVSLVFDQLGEAHLLAWARKNPGAFYGIAARLVPPGTPVNLGALDGTFSDQAKTVIARMAEGRITPEQASTIMGALASQARVVEVDEYGKRIAALEGKLNGKHANQARTD